MWQCALKDWKTRDQKMVWDIVTTLNKTKNLAKASFSCCMVIYLSLRFSFCFSFLGNYICVNYSKWRIHQWHFICTWLRLVNMSWHTTIKCTCRKTIFDLVHKQIITIVRQYLYSWFHVLLEWIWYKKCFVNLDLYVYIDLPVIRLLTAHKYSVPIKSGQLSVYFTGKVNLKTYEGLNQSLFCINYYVCIPYQDIQNVSWSVPLADVVLIYSFDLIIIIILP